MKKTRVRFAPSPTGALHIGGIRTALYNFLFARQTGGTFILRIEDTDQGRYVPGAEAYILEALEWFGLTPDEGPGFGDGAYGPYRQSERKAIYAAYAKELVENGHAYYAFDTQEELDQRRQEAQERGGAAFKYDSQTRPSLVNSLSLSPEETQERIARGDNWVIRLKVPTDTTIIVEDMVRGTVSFQSNELDDKVMLKSDGMPTYHLANIVDDHLMEITHVIRGEEWLPSTAHHVLLYQSFGWEKPQFAHLPLILKPNGQGKLSKRDGVVLGIPVFPLGWKGNSQEDSFLGFREVGFLPEAAVNFLALLGWNPGTDQEIFSMDNLIQAFSIEKIGKSGARFDFDKARWFNQQYLSATPDAILAKKVGPLIEAQGHTPTPSFLEAFCGLMKERCVLLSDFWDNGRSFFEEVTVFDEKTIAKKWDASKKTLFDALIEVLQTLDSFELTQVHDAMEAWMTREGIKPGDIFPLLRIALFGSMKGPGVSEMISLLGMEAVAQRLQHAARRFDALIAG